MVSRSKACVTAETCVPRAIDRHKQTHRVSFSVRAGTEAQTQLTPRRGGDYFYIYAMEENRLYSM